VDAMPVGFLADPEHQVDGSMAAAPAASPPPVPISRTQGVISRPGNNPPVQAQIDNPAPVAAPAGFKPDVTNNSDNSDTLGYHPMDVAQLTKAGLPDDRAVAIAKKLYASDDNSDPMAPMSRTRQAIAAVMGAATGLPALGEAAGAEGLYQGGKFSAQKLGQTLSEDAAANTAKAAEPFQEWQRTVPQLAADAAKSKAGTAALSFMRMHPYWGYGFGGSATGYAIYHAVKAAYQGLNALGE
jgi:hypothetical protein